MILILAGAEEPHAEHVAEALAERGVEAVRIDSQWFPERLTLAMDPAARSGEIGLPEGRRVAWDQIEAVYWRSYGGVAESPLPDPEQAFLATNDARGLFESWLLELPCRWVNGLRAFRLHQTKPAQLAIVSRLGVPIPRTLLTNDPAAVREFAAAGGGLLFKPVQGGAHTEPLTTEHLTEANLANLRYAPVTIQEEIQGTNIRVFVAGERTLACEVATEAVDFRDDAYADLRPVELPADIADQALRVAGALDLLWTGIDYRRRPGGEYVFLEANPSPMFIGFEEATGLPLTEALCDLLAGP